MKLWFNLCTRSTRWTDTFHIVCRKRQILRRSCVHIMHSNFLEAPCFRLENLLEKCVFVSHCCKQRFAYFHADRVCMLFCKQCCAHVHAHSRLLIFWHVRLVVVAWQKNTVITVTNCVDGNKGVKNCRARKGGNIPHLCCQILSWFKTVLSTKKLTQESTHITVNLLTGLKIQRVTAPQDWLCHIDLVHSRCPPWTSPNNHRTQ